MSHTLICGGWVGGGGGGVLKHKSGKKFWLGGKVERVGPDLLTERSVSSSFLWLIWANNGQGGYYCTTKICRKGNPETWKAQMRDVCHLIHWLHFRQLRTWIHDNLCYLTIRVTLDRIRNSCDVVTILTALDSWSLGSSESSQSSASSLTRVTSV